MSRLVGLSLEPWAESVLTIHFVYHEYKETNNSLLSTPSNYLLRAQERPATLILTVTSGSHLTRAHHVYNRDAETGKDQFRYIKIRSQTIDLRTRLWGINPTNSVFIPQNLVLRFIVWGWILIYRNWSIKILFCSKERSECKKCVNHNSLSHGIQASVTPAQTFAETQGAHNLAE